MKLSVAREALLDRLQTLVRVASTHSVVQALSGVQLDASDAGIELRATDLEVGLRMLLLRHFVEEENGLYRANPREEVLLRYYANSIAHLLPAAKPDVAAAAE